MGTGPEGHYDIGGIALFDGFERGLGRSAFDVDLRIGGGELSTEDFIEGFCVFDHIHGLV